MKHEQIGPKRRRPTNVSLPEELVLEAKRLDINISRECTAGLSAAVRRESDRRFQEEHRDRIDAWNVWFEENGMPFEDLRVW